jgi:hypothetical protein
MSAESTTGAVQAPPNPALLMRLALAYRSSMVLFAATELGVFSALANGPLDAANVADACQGQLEPVRMVLGACVAEGLLAVTDGKYANTPLTDAFLVRGRPAYSANGLKYAQDLYAAWGALTSFVRSGTPPMAHDEILGDDKEKTRAFVYAMHERAKGIGSIMPHLDLPGRRHLLDVGGGPGTYSASLVEKTPGLRATVLDLPGILAVTRDLVAANPHADRITLREGNYMTSAFGNGYDAVLLSGMMHRETPDTCRLLLHKSFDALDRGGLAIVSDVFFDDDLKTSPPFAVYFALNMMLTSDHGSAHSKGEMARWMTEAGFDHIEIRNLPQPNPHTLLLGSKS